MPCARPKSEIDADLPDLQKSGVLRMSLSIGKICPVEITLLIWSGPPLENPVYNHVKFLVR